MHEKKNVQFIYNCIIIERLEHFDCHYSKIVKFNVACCSKSCVQYLFNTFSVSIVYICAQNCVGLTQRETASDMSTCKDCISLQCV